MNALPSPTLKVPIILNELFLRAVMRAVCGRLYFTRDDGIGRKG